ncbi:hypothetical protein [Halomontanus rarus]|uniref:hypothetical protein n=1 Tax=Halomontanus rarus TaxID=3034020 RepID=UPI001A997F14
MNLAERTQPNRWRSTGTVAIGLVLALQVVLLLSSYADGGVRPVAATLAAPFVCLALLVGYARDRHRTIGFNVVVFTGWAVLVGVGYVLEPSRETALIGGLVTAFAVYYGFRYVGGGSEDGGDSNSGSGSDSDSGSGSGTATDSSRSPNRSSAVPAPLELVFVDRFATRGAVAGTLAGVPKLGPLGLARVVWIGADPPVRGDRPGVLGDAETGANEQKHRPDRDHDDDEDRQPVGCLEIHAV